VFDLAESTPRQPEISLSVFLLDAETTTNKIVAVGKSPGRKDQ